MSHIFSKFLRRFSISASSKHIALRPLAKVWAQTRVQKRAAAVARRLPPFTQLPQLSSRVERLFSACCAHGRAYLRAPQLSSSTALRHRRSSKREMCAGQDCSQLEQLVKFASLIHLSHYRKKKTPALRLIGYLGRVNTPGANLNSVRELVVGEYFWETPRACDERKECGRTLANARTTICRPTVTSDSKRYGRNELATFCGASLTMKKLIYCC